MLLCSMFEKLIEAKKNVLPSLNLLAVIESNQTQQYMFMYHFKVNLKDICTRLFEQRYYFY